MPLFTPIGGGGIGKATVTATTGSPSVDTTTRAGKTIYRFTNSGSITIGTAGNAEFLIVGGGGGGGNAKAGGGAGGMLYESSAYLPAGTLTVTVGTGGVGGEYNSGYNGGQTGNSSSIGGDYVGIGGGGGAAANQSFGHNGGSGGGGGDGTNGLGFPGQGNNGSGNTGGGAGGIPTGLANSITGTSVTYATGGSRSASTVNGTANTGGGGWGSTSTSTVAGSGGSGVVIIVVG
jgi:hypothetical protein